jgi:hypothetical protein
MYSPGSSRCNSAPQAEEIPRRRADELQRLSGDGQSRVGTAFSESKEWDARPWPTAAWRLP